MGWGEMEHLLFLLMEVPLSQQSSAALHWQGISPALCPLGKWAKKNTWTVEKFPQD